MQKDLNRQKSISKWLINVRYKLHYSTEKCKLKSNENISTIHLNGKPRNILNIEENVKQSKLSCDADGSLMRINTLEN